MMVTVPMLRHADFGPNDYWEDAPLFMNLPESNIFIERNLKLQNTTFCS